MSHAYHGGAGSPVGVNTLILVIPVGILAGLNRPEAN